MKRIRVLVEFPEDLLMRTDAAAKENKQSRSKLIRTAVERFVLEVELTDAYIANAREEIV